MSFYHIPVLLHEAAELLINRKFENQILVDGTLGGGGYTRVICDKTKAGDRIISIDKDLNAIEYARNILNDCDERITFVNSNFGELKKILGENKISKITGLVLDLGLSSYQLESEEGFSFMRDTELDMRAYKKDELTAAEVLNSFRKEELVKIFEDYGEIGNSERLAKLVAERRRVQKFKTTFDIVKLIDEGYRINKKNQIDFLAKIFQALRIKVNNELENLETVLKDSTELLIPGGRLVVVSYHSLEDRMVKNFFKEKSSKYTDSENPFYKTERQPELKTLTKKPVVPTHEEIKQNSRSRSAKLRAAEKL